MGEYSFLVSSDGVPAGCAGAAVSESLYWHAERHCCSVSKRFSFPCCTQIAIKPRDHLAPFLKFILCSLRIGTVGT